MQRYDQYDNPLVSRYASAEMSFNFSPTKKFQTWRRLWIALAEAEKELGLPISEEQIAEMRAHQDTINFADAERKEREIRHDVMAHIYAYGLQCPRAKPIIHLGATSAFVGDNTDLIQMRDGLLLLQKKLVNLIQTLATFAWEYRDMVTLGYTHFQPAQCTTVGKRATLWLQDLVLDLEHLEFLLSRLRFRGVKGTTGTQDSFLKLLGGDQEKVVRLDQMVTEKMGFSQRFLVTGQTYPRKVDSQVLSLLSGIAQSAHKFSNDLRLLQHLREMEEPFDPQQVGSSAMAYKRNPMRSERMAALARYVISLESNPAFTAAGQWFERTLDDSANRRLAIAQAFLGTDAILNLYLNISRGLRVYPEVIARRVAEELPFIATEEILMAGVKAGGDRQVLHERIRVHAMAVAQRIKEGGRNDLLERIAQDPAFSQIKDQLPSLLDPRRFVGRAPQQVEEFLREVIEPIRQRYRHIGSEEGEVRV
ncbi:MAG: adenylosuccinate lyase [Nitrospinota bacterium]|nr:MAG: adenylosuccinate lyase [Nitrospinota bacterium]